MNPMYESLWQQLGAALAMLRNGVTLMPDDLWDSHLWVVPEDEPETYSTVWFIIYHTLYWTDLFLTGSREAFSPPEGFRREEWDAETGLPRRYTKEELLAFLTHCHDRARDTYRKMTDESASRICEFPWMTLSYFELQMYSMRHIQEHTSQINHILGLNGMEASDWEAQAG